MCVSVSWTTCVPGTWEGQKRPSVSWRSARWLLSCPVWVLGLNSSRPQEQYRLLIVKPHCQSLSAGLLLDWFSYLTWNSPLLRLVASQLQASACFHLLVLRLQVCWEWNSGPCNCVASTFQPSHLPSLLLPSGTFVVVSCWTLWNCAAKFLHGFVRRCNELNWINLIPVRLAFSLREDIPSVV
jgi:hypothetical protein